MTANVGMIDSGSAAAPIKVARQSRRNHQMTSTARIAPSYSISIEARYWRCVCATPLCTSSIGEARMLVLQLGQRAGDAGRDLGLVIALAARDLEPDGGFAVEQRGLRALGDRVDDVRHLVEPDRPAVGERHRQRGEVARLSHRCDRAHALLACR